MVGLSSRCRCRCECVTGSALGDVVRNHHHPPDAILEGHAMAGLVAILRRLGDLAELAADVFDDIQDRVMAASARARRLAARAKRLLEADLELDLVEGVDSADALTIATSSSGRVGCRAHHPRGGVGEGGTPPMPRLIVQRIRRCRGPPKLSLLDKFDAAGEGACLKRYTDPSFFFRAHSARLEQHTLRVRANHRPYLLKSMSMETRPKFQTALNSEPAESAHTDSKSETEETDASESETPSPGFLSMLRQLKQHRHRQAAGAGSPFRTQQTVDRVQSSPQLNMEHKLQSGGSSQPSPSPSELERTSSFEAWLAPDACSFTTATHHNEHDEIITQEQEPPHAHAVTATTANCSGSVSHDVTTTSNADAALSSSTILKAIKVKGASNKTSWRYKGSVEMIASRVTSFPRKLFSNIKHHNSDPAGTISQATGTIGDCCSPEVEAIPTPRETFLPILLPSNPVVYSSIHNLLPLPENEDPSTDQCSNSNSSTPETCTTPNSKNLLLPASLVLKRAGALPENSSSEDAKVDTAPPLPPIPPMQWLSERVHTGTRAASPKHRALWKKPQEATEMIKAIRRAHSHSIQTSPVDREETLVSNENTSANVSHRDEMKCSESEQTRHPQPFRVTEDAVQASSGGIVLKDGEFPVPAVDEEAWSEIDLRTQAQAGTCFQQQARARQQFCSSGHSDEKPSGGHESSDSSSNLQNESVFFSAVQELAKMSPPPSVPVPGPKYSLLDTGCHGRITLRNGPSLIHPSRNILDSRSVLIKQIKDIAMADNSSFKLKPVSGTSSPQSPVTGSPKVATILQRADDIRKAHADSNDVDSDKSWSDDTE